MHVWPFLFLQRTIFYIIVFRGEVSQHFIQVLLFNNVSATIILADEAPHADRLVIYVNCILLLLSAIPQSHIALTTNAARVDQRSSQSL